MVILENEIEINSSKAKVAVVRWVKKVEGEIYKYRVGLKFVTPQFNEEAGKHFDPKVVEAFLKVISEE